MELYLTPQHKKEQHKKMHRRFTALYIVKSFFEQTDLDSSL